MAGLADDPAAAAGHIKQAMIYAEAARWADGQYAVTTAAYASDIDNDGYQEMVLHNDRLFAVFEAIGGRCTNLAGKMSLKESGALLAAARYVVCNDSVSFHMARAVGTQAFVIFGRDTAIQGDFTATLDLLGELDGRNGFVIGGIGSTDGLGTRFAQNSYLHRCSTERHLLSRLQRILDDESSS